MKKEIRYTVEAKDGFIHSYNSQIPNALSYALDSALFERGRLYECDIDILGHEGPQKLIEDFSKWNGNSKGLRPRQPKL